MQKIAFVVSLLGTYTQAVGDGSHTKRVDYSDAGKKWTEGKCATGKSQSPIDLVDVVDSKFAAAGGYHLRGGDFGTLNSAQGDQDSLKGWNYLDLQYKGFVSLDVDEMVDGVMTKVKKNYRPLRMDFKSPAEHYISKEKDDEMDLEVQISLAEQSSMVGNAAAPVAAVLSVFYKAGPDTGDYPTETNKSFDSLKIGKSNDRTIAQFDLDDYVNDFSVGEYYTYEGSLTEPPCTEGIRWILLPKYKEITKAQKKMLTNLWDDEWKGGRGFGVRHKYKDGNSRAFQKLNDRKVYKGNNYFESTATMVTTAALFTTASMIALSSF